MTDLHINGSVGKYSFTFLCSITVHSETQAYLTLNSHRANTTYQGSAISSHFKSLYLCVDYTENVLISNQDLKVFDV